MEQGSNIKISLNFTGDIFPIISVEIKKITEKKSSNREWDSKSPLNHLDEEQYYYEIDK